MNQENDRTSESNITDDTQSLLAAVADVTEEKVAQARNRLAATLRRRERHLRSEDPSRWQSAKATDRTIRRYLPGPIGSPWTSMVGFLLDCGGCLSRRSGSRKTISRLCHFFLGDICYRCEQRLGIVCYVLILMFGRSLDSYFSFMATIIPFTGLDAGSAHLRPRR